jgi:hypothetical protein
MPNDEHVAMLGRGTAAWSEWRADHDETPDLSRTGLRGLDLSGFAGRPSRCRSPGHELERGELVGCSSGRRELLQGGARWGRSRRGFFEWSPIPQLRSARGHPELGSRPSVMRRLSVAPLFRTECLRNRLPRTRRGRIIASTPRGIRKVSDKRSSEKE